MLRIEEINDENVWDSFVTAQSHYTFLHSWQWGEFQKSMGEKIWRIGVRKEGELFAVALVILVRARRGYFLFIPHGPIFKEDDSAAQKKVLELILPYLKEIASSNRALFIRISSLLEDTLEKKNIFAKLGFRPAPMHMHAEITWSLDLAPDEKELLANMRKTTRNLVRRAEKEGLVISAGTSYEMLKKFYALYAATAKRQGFVPFSADFIKNEADTFGEKGIVTVLGTHEGKVLAGAVIPMYGQMAFYHHGASLDGAAKIPAAYGVQWAAIKEAKKLGKKVYNFWGISAENDTKHPWAGLSLFKRGFGGYETRYLHAQDLPLSPRYFFVWIIESLRRMRRRY